MVENFVSYSKVKQKRHQFSFLTVFLSGNADSPIHPGDCPYKTNGLYYYLQSSPIQVYMNELHA